MMSPHRNVVILVKLLAYGFIDFREITEKLDKFISMYEMQVILLTSDT